ncbi:MAG: molybdopterin molybdenumtransferase MoeA [Limnohabitans sp.]|nr:molybdopterin molybdenumtransferase MoeA [Limnohabitans sp.]
MTHPPSLADIAAQLEAYDPQALPANEVLNFLDHLVTPVQDSELVDIFAALGRVTAQDVISPINVPPHDNSAMDGFAFDGAPLSASQALSLKVVGTALAGKGWEGSVNAGECVKIMTGAIMPKGLNTVVPQELCSMTASDVVEIPAGLLKAGDNLRLCGEDIMQGQAALLKGAWITPAAAGLLASLGVPNVSVVRRLRVAYFSTGDEILSLGQAPREGAVYDSNRYTVHGMLQALGCEMIDMGVVKDNPELLEQAFNKATEQADAIITSGGVSVGEADFTKAMMKKLGDVVFWKIAMRPGRPMAVGRIQKGQRSAVLFGLPGNPVAVMVTFLAFVKPALLKMMGSTATPLPMLRARTQEVLRKKPGRTEYQRGIFSRNAQGELQVITTGNQGSGVLSSMVQANGLIVLSHQQDTAQLGDWVDVLVL